MPLSTILQRNASADIPDQILERVFLVLGILIQDWWWNCDLAVWTQLFMLCGATFGGIKGGKGKAKERDNETKEAAVKCLLQLVHPRPDGAARQKDIISNAQTAKFTPVLGQTVDSLLAVAETNALTLQMASLETLHHLVVLFIPRSLSPTVLPGIVSTSCKVALGTSSKKGWSNGEVVASALLVLQDIIVSAIADDVCTQAGAIRSIGTLEDLLVDDDRNNNAKDEGTQPAYAVRRSPSWLQGTASQLHIAMNSISSLVSHPTASALAGLTTFSHAILDATPNTLPQSQPLLLAWLLRLCVSDYPSVKFQAHTSITSLLSPKSKSRTHIQDALVGVLNDSFAALPRLIVSGAEARIEHVAGMVEAACSLALVDQMGLGSLLSGIGHLLGPSGGVEKWGWNLLSVLRFHGPSIIMTSSTSVGQLHIENEAADVSHWASFPALSLENISTHGTSAALIKMLHSLGRAGGDNTLHSVEWFFNAGCKSDRAESVAALWLACRLLEGAGNLALELPFETSGAEVSQSPRLRKLVRGLCTSISEMWDELAELSTMSADTAPLEEAQQEVSSDIQHFKGVQQLADNLQIFSPSASSNPKASTSHPAIHRSLLLQLLSLSSGILQSRFPRTFIYTLYPILHSLVSPYSVLSATAIAALHFITVQTSYASPSNLLLSNFDYALDSVSRRLTRRWLDLDAPRVLVILVRLVGEDIVDRAGDVVEECFDRLDDYHGYSVLVERLTEVLSEVVKVIASGNVKPGEKERTPGVSERETDVEMYSLLLQWLQDRKESAQRDSGTSEYGPAPHEPWGPPRSDTTDPDEPEDENQNPDAAPVPTPIQTLTQQIVTRASYFLSHGSPVIKARILSLLAAAVPVLDASALMPAVQSAWPFILNRLADPETFVVSAAASLLESLSTVVGEFIFHKLWDDIWPRFSTILQKLELGDGQSALVRRGRGAVGTESAYTHSHRMYKSLMRTMTAAAQGVDPKDESIWEVIVAFRRFLHIEVHDELQAQARELYLALSIRNADSVWLALTGTFTDDLPDVRFLRESKWDGVANLEIILSA